MNTDVILKFNLYRRLNNFSIYAISSATSVVEIRYVKLQPNFFRSTYYQSSSFIIN